MEGAGLRDGNQQLCFSHVNFEIHGSGKEILKE